jgi:hypothetical protein
VSHHYEEHTTERKPTPHPKARKLTNKQLTNAIDRRKRDLDKRVKEARTADDRVADAKLALEGYVAERQRRCKHKKADGGPGMGGFISVECPTCGLSDVY